jgi:hypothetical protein
MGPRTLLRKKVNKTNGETLMRHVRVGGEPGGGPLGSSYEKLNADAMMTLEERICCSSVMEGGSVVEGTCSKHNPVWSSLNTRL